MSGDVSLNGGSINVGRDLSGTVAIAGDLALTNSGQFTVGRNLGATASGAASDTVAANSTVESGSLGATASVAPTDTVTGNLTVDSGSCAFRWRKLKRAQRRRQC